jgi:NADH:quinone reductase (non-electrogenic)
VKQYAYHSLGVVATLGLGRGVFQYRRLVIKGFLAWVMHRGYHVLAVPTWERKIRVLLVWLSAALFGRDIVSLQSVQQPRAAFAAAGVPRPATAGAPPRSMGIASAPLPSPTALGHRPDARDRVNRSPQHARLLPEASIDGAKVVGSSGCNSPWPIGDPPCSRA